MIGMNTLMGDLDLQSGAVVCILTRVCLVRVGGYPRS